MKKIISLALAVLLVFSCCAFCEASGAAAELTAGVATINKYGNVILDIPYDKLTKNGMEIADIIAVTVGNTVYEMPIGTSFSDVDTGTMICRYDMEDGVVMLCINNGSFAAFTGLAQKEIPAEGGYRWNVFIASVSLTLKEKAGYAVEYQLRKLTRSNERADYAALSDADFANFRTVAVSGMKDNTVYRSSSPIDASLGRNEYTMNAMREAGIQTVLNLSDSFADMSAYAAYANSYYSACKILNAEMTVDYASAEFAEKVKECVLFIGENEAPYLIHCKEGKDRSGILCAVLKCFCGARFDEIAEDYMLSYENFYGVEKNSEAYRLILNSSFVKSMEKLFCASELQTADLQSLAENYLKSIGLEDAALNALAKALKK